MTHQLFSEINGDQLHHLFIHMIKKGWEPRIDYLDQGSLSAYTGNYWFKWGESTETYFDLSKPLSEQKSEVLDNILLIFK